MTINYWNLLNKEEIKTELLKIINDPEKFDIILRDSFGNRIIYAMDPEKFNKETEEVALSRCYDEGTALEVAKATIIDHVDEVAEWITARSAALRLSTEFDKPIGQIKDGNNITESNTSIVTLRCSLNKENEYKFYIACAAPHIEYKN